jgi:phage repressor protein C with HTH and peptisase S24 domain
MAIDRLAQNCGHSTSGLAKKAGLDPTSFNKSKRIGVDGKPRWPSTESISRILSATNFTMTEFIELIDSSTVTPKSQTRIPVLAIAQAKRDSHFDKDGFPSGDAWDHIDFPQTTGNIGTVYALEISGNAMLPIFREGDRLIVAPNAPMRRGDRVVVRTISGDIFAHEFVRQTTSKIELKPLNPDDEDVAFSAKDISWVARIVWVSQ